MLGVVAAAAAPAPGPAWSTVFTTWRTTWGAEIVVTALAALYLRAALQVPGWPVVRTVSALGALAVAIVTVDSGIGLHAPRSFPVDVLMQLLLIVAVPALWVAGRPLELLERASSERVSAALHRFRHGAAARTLTAPPTVLALSTLVVVLTHLIAVPVAVVQLLCLGAGLLFLHTALGLDRRSGHLRAAPRFLLMLAWIGVNTAVGLALVVAPTALVPIFPPGDVRLGGAMTCVIGDGAMLMIMAAMAASSRRAARLSEPGRCPVC